MWPTKAVPGRDPGARHPHTPAFETLEEARAVIGAFIERYNNGWLLQRHGYLTRPAPARSSAAGQPDV